ncbi:MAG: hypothetical protein KF726_17500 [Anaerolineae bacterium]|nr:hypothetical protein [Anaerolineae bacterium]
MPLPDFLADNASITSNALKVVLSYGGETGYRFTTEVYANNAWQRGSDALNTATPIQGLIDSAHTSTAEELILSGATNECHWQTRLTPQTGGFWVTTELTVDKPITLNPVPLLWLGTLDRLDDRQAHTWRQTILRAPTTNQQGLSGNDLPAGYLYDDASKLETICYFPADNLTWLPYRLCQFTVREVFSYTIDGGNRYGFGLLPVDAYSKIEFPSGEHKLRWWFTQRRYDRTPTLWQAQRRLIEAVGPLLDPQPIVSGLANTTWQRMAEGTLIDLKNPACWIEADSVQGLRAYVAGSSRVGRDQQQGFELMTQLDVLLPLLLWRQTLPENHDLRDSADELIARLRATLERFHRPDVNFFANHFPVRSRDTFMDTWYFFENALIKLPWVAYLSNDANLHDIFFDVLKGARKLAHNVGYLFPLFADAGDWLPRGSLLNVSTGGMYAAGQLIAYQLSGEQGHLEEAAQALRVIAQLSPAQLTHEPQQLSYGAAAAGYLAKVTGADHYSEIADDLITLLLRMGYWNTDPSVPYYDPRGMFQACASLCYPAFKENVECLIAFPELLRGNSSLKRLLATFVNLQRHHNLSFFDPFLPSELRVGPCVHIPYEDLATAEFPHTATLGKELYGAGEVFWSALLFDMLGQVDDSSVLCLSLDVPCVELCAFPPSARRQFLLYNPTDSEKEVSVTANFPKPVRLTVLLAPSENRLVSIDRSD